MLKVLPTAQQSLGLVQVTPVKTPGLGLGVLTMAQLLPASCSISGGLSPVERRPPAAQQSPALAQVTPDKPVLGWPGGGHFGAGG